jgi:uncharacterized protein YbjT (DUF2867 family)
MEAAMYVITGATGNTGSVIASRLLAGGQKVRAIGRDAKRLESLARKGAEVLVASVEDAAALTRAFTGARAVYVMIPPAGQSPDVRAFQERVSDAYAAALRDSGVPYAVLLSSVGADKPEKTGPILGLRSLEQKVNRIAPLNVLSLRATTFLDNLMAQAPVIQAMGSLAGELRPDLKFPMIATGDIGVYAAERLLRLDFQGQQTQELLGAEEVSYQQAASVIGKAIGKPGLAYVQLPPEQVRLALLQMGMSASMADLLLEMTESINRGYIVPLEKRSGKNTTPTTLQQFVAEVFAPAFRARAASA